jgi:hypothetical protein
MKSVLLLVCLMAPAISAPTTLDVTRVSNFEGDIAMGMAIPSTLNCVPSTEIVALPSDRYEVHAVVVDMPQRASLYYASPETWGTLPMSDPPYEQSPYEQSPYEQSPATTVLQVAMN